MTAELPFLGVGISSAIGEAPTLAEGRLAERWPQMSALGFLNVGLNGATVVPPELPALLGRSGLACVAHLEDINLVTALDERRLEHIVECARFLRPRWLQEDLGVWVWGSTPLVEQMIPPIFDEASLSVATDNVARIMDASGLPFLAENPPIHYVLGDIDLLAFMGALSERTGCGLIIDIGHLASYCHCTGRDPVAYLSGWDGLNRVRELHLAGSDTVETTRGVLWTDAHQLPLLPESLDILDLLLQRTSGVRAITLEVEGAPVETLWDSVARVCERIELEGDDAGE
jgi:uncharacterized protein (UPF0276 family)